VQLEQRVERGPELGLIGDRARDEPTFE
jgi:hypothetical protein